MFNNTAQTRHFSFNRPVMSLSGPSFRLNSTVRTNLFYGQIFTLNFSHILSCGGSLDAITSALNKNNKTQDAWLSLLDEWPKAILRTISSVVETSQ
jgi:hypothetical protein